MACGCAHSIRWVTRTTICLDVVYDILGKQKRTQDGRIADGADTQPLLLESPPDAADSKSKKQSNSKVNWCFFLGGIGLSLLWNAFAFIVPYWVLHYDPNIWRDFVVCYNAPGFPILVLQLLTDEKLAKRFGTRKTYIARITFSFLLVAVLAALVPITQLTGKQFGRFEMLAFTTCIGIAVGSGHGWIYSVVSYYPHQAVAYLAAGGGFATIMLVIITFVQDYPPDETLADLFKYFEPVFLLSIVGSLCVVALFFTNYSKVLLNNIDHQTYGGIQESHEAEPGLKDEKPAARDVSGPIWKIIWSPLVSVFLLMTTIVAAVALIPSIPSATNNPNFSAYILYVTTIFAFVGNEIAVYLKAMTSSWPLVIFSALRFLMLPFFIVYAETKFWLNDYFILSMLAIFGATGAFGVSKCYSVCSMSVSVNQQASASNYLNIVLYVGVYVGLAFPYVLPYL